jgi:hypothetical protein
MDKQAQVQTGPEQDPVIEQKIQRLRELFADAPEVGKTALENVLLRRPVRLAVRS